MLSPKNNEQITRTGPGTPMGEYLRRYWLPAITSREVPEPDCPPIRVKLLNEDRSICVLVLGASSSGEGPGPLVTAFTGKSASQLRIPLTIVPGALSEAEIDAIS